MNSKLVVLARLWEEGGVKMAEIPVPWSYPGFCSRGTQPVLPQGSLEKKPKMNYPTMYGCNEGEKERKRYSECGNVLSNEAI